MGPRRSLVKLLCHRRVRCHFTFVPRGSSSFTVMPPPGEMLCQLTSPVSLPASRSCRHRARVRGVGWAPLLARSPITTPFLAQLV